MERFFMERLKYIVEDSTIAELLGVQNFTNKESAILELVKNAYDAQASTVSITFSDHSIVIVDDGIGMSKSTIYENWMNVGKSDKGYRLFGVGENDGRVFAEFARCVIENKNITLKTKGDTKRSYLYTEDAISAILKVMTADVAGEVFNVANENTYCSIYEMAKLVAQTISKGSIDVVIAEDHSNYNGYAPTLHMNLDTSKLCSLGWTASTSLTQMFVELIHWMREHKYE